MPTFRTDSPPAPLRAPEAPRWDVLANGVRMVALRELRDPAAAADVAHETIERAMAALEGARGAEIGNLGAYIYGIARHVIADHQRRQERFVALDGVPEPAAPARDPLEAAVASEERARLKEALSTLAPAEREVVRLFYFEALDDRAIAERVHDNPVSVRKRRSRAMARLRLAMLGHKNPATATDR